MGQYHELQGNIMEHTGGFETAVLVFSREVSSAMHKWRFKIKRFGDRFARWIMIGIWKSKTGDVPNNGWFTKHQNGYALVVGRGQLASRTAGGHFAGPYGIECNARDIVDMIVNLDINTLSFHINEQDYGVAYNIDHDIYKAAIMTYYTGESVEFIEYDQM